MSSREEFEAWYLNRNYKDFQDLGKQWLEKLPDGDYLRSAPSISWAAWQASRAELAIEMPSTKYISEPEAFVLYDDIKRALEDAGIKVKP